MTEHDLEQARQDISLRVHARQASLEFGQVTFEPSQKLRPLGEIVGDGRFERLQRLELLGRELGRHLQKLLSDDCKRLRNSSEKGISRFAKVAHRLGEMCSNTARNQV